MSQDRTTKIFVKPLSVADELFVEFLTDRYENGDGTPLKQEQTDVLLVVNYFDIRRKRAVTYETQTRAPSEVLTSQIRGL